MATSFVLPDESEFVNQSDVIALVRVDDITSVKDDFGITTKIDLTVEKGFKGALAEDKLPIYQIGGKVGEDVFWIDGSPEYKRGERSLVFLKRLDDGTLTTNIFEVGRIPANKGEGDEILLSKSPVVSDGSVRAFQQRLQDKFRLRATQRVEFKTKTLDGLSEAQIQFRFLNPPSKWRLQVPVWSPTIPEASLGQAASDRLINNAIQAWGSVPGSSLSLARAGTQVPGGMSCISGKLSISFNDPKNQINNPSNCSGALALGGFCSSGSTGSDGFQTINAGVLTVGDGWNGCWFWNEPNVSEIMTHEIGHALGLAHSAESNQPADTVQRDATMYYMAHFDGRGASSNTLLKTYDKGAIAALYQGVVGPTPTPTIIPTVTPIKTPIPTSSSNDGFIIATINVRFYPKTHKLTSVSVITATESIDLKNGLQIKIDGGGGAFVDTLIAPASAVKANGTSLYYKTKEGNIINAVQYKNNTTKINVTFTTGDLDTFINGNVTLSVIGSSAYSTSIICNKRSNTNSLVTYECR